MANIRTAIGLSLIVLIMITLVAFSVPIYDLFCRVTGFGGKTNISEFSSNTILERDINLKFNADVNDSINWSFEAPEKINFKVGENMLVNYKATNLSNVENIGTATFNVLPQKVGPYFIKTQCFCFEKQTLKPGETVEMPVVFYVDPSISEDPTMKDVEEITLSYTFFKYIE